MSKLSNKTVKTYSKVVLDIIKDIAAAKDMNEKLLIIAEYGEISRALNELMAGVAFNESNEDVDTAIQEVEKILESLAMSEGTFTFGNGDPVGGATA